MAKNVTLNGRCSQIAINALPDAAAIHNPSGPSNNMPACLRLALFVFWFDSAPPLTRKTYLVFLSFFFPLALALKGRSSLDVPALRVERWMRRDEMIFIARL